MKRDGKISELALEQYLLGELEEQEQFEVETALKADPSLRSSLQAMENANRVFLERFPPTLLMGNIHKQLQQSTGTLQPNRLRSKRYWVLSPVLAVLLLVLIIWHPWQSPRPKPELSTPETDSVLIKGRSLSTSVRETQLLAYRMRAQQVESIQNGATAKAGDLLQLAYFSAGKQYGVIFSIDGHKRVSLHFPATMTGSTQLEQNRRIVLPEAIELDDAPKFERFFFLTSDRPIPIDPILKTAARFATGSMDPSQGRPQFWEGIEVHSFIINKRNNQ